MPETEEQPQDRDAVEGEFSSSAEESPCADQPLPLRIEALLLATDRPMSDGRLREVLGLSGRGATQQIHEAVEELNRAYEESGRSFRVEAVAGGWQLLTRREFGPLLAAAHGEKQSTRLSQAALETLAIVAYRQPIMRAEIEAIRGVSSGEVLRGLMERRLIKITGRAEELGRPMLYGTTREFLKVFGLAGLDDLPQVEGLDVDRANGTSKVDREGSDDDPEESGADRKAESSPDDSPGEGHATEPSEPQPE